MKSISRFFVGALLIGVFIVPQASSAMTNDEIRAQIESLLSQVKAMRAQLPQLETASSSSPMVVCRELKRNLQFGDRGEEVKLLQEMLTEAGYSPDTDGTFGEETGAAVSGFQQEYKNELLSPVGLKAPTGYVGNLTRAKLNSLCKKRPPVTTNLVCAQPPMPTCPEGKACPQLFPAPTTYPSEEAAKAAGATILHKGPCKNEIVPSCRVITQYLRPGSSGDEVKLLQERLTAEGFPVQQTGYFGPITAKAVSQFQNKFKEQVLMAAGVSTSTGTVGEFTRKRLNEWCPNPPTVTAPPITEIKPPIETKQPIFAATAVCAQPPMPICPEGKACVQVMPALTTYPTEEAAKNAGATILYKGMCTSNLVQ